MGRSRQPRHRRRMTAPRRSARRRRCPRPAGGRRGPPARQLHDQPLRRPARRAGPGAARRRRRPGGDPDLPGTHRPRHGRRRRRCPTRRSTAGRRIECESLLPQLDLTVDGDGGAADPDRGRAVVPAGRRWPADDAAGVRPRGAARRPRSGRRRRRSPSPTGRSRSASAGARSWSRRRRRRWRRRPVPTTSRTTSVSQRLTAYPEDRIARRSMTPRSRSWRPPADRRSRPRSSRMPSRVAAADRPRPAPLARDGAARPSTPAAAAVPGGVGGEVPDIFRAADLTPVVFLLSS